MPRMSKKLPEQLKMELETSNVVFHTGDWQTIEVAEALREYAPVKGVVGNVDGEEIRKSFPERLIVELPGLRVGITHGHGKGKTTEKRAMDTFKNESIDLLIYGHSHIPVHKKVGNLTLFNPGSPTDKRKQPSFSFGILALLDGEWQLSHVFYDTKE